MACVRDQGIAVIQCLEQDVRGDGGFHITGRVPARHGCCDGNVSAGCKFWEQLAEMSALSRDAVEDDGIQHVVFGC